MASTHKLCSFQPIYSGIFMIQAVHESNPFQIQPSSEDLQYTGCSLWRGSHFLFLQGFFFFFFDTTLFEPFISRLMGLEGSLTKWVSGWRIFNDTCRKLDGFVTVLAPTSTKHLRMNLWLKHAQVLSCNVLGWATMLIYVCSHCWFHK